MRRTLCASALVLICALPATARADTLTNANGTLTFTADHRAIVNIQNGMPGSSLVVVYPNRDPDSVVGCSPPPILCDGVTRIELIGSPEDDGLHGPGMTPSHLVGGAGNDDLGGGSAGDVIDGGPGVDSVNFVQYDPGPLTISLDGRANDGVPGQGANVEPDVEDIHAFSNGASTGMVLAGSAAANVLEASGADAVITGGDGADRLIGRGGDDTLLADDGYADRLECGGGDDRAVVDKLDQVAADCEHVTVVDAGTVTNDHPPAVAWARIGTMLSANGATMLRVDASDDKGVTSVKFFSGSRLVCEDATAPYACTFRPRGADVGRDTLTAVAADVLGQTTTVLHTVTVSRFKASRLSLQITRGGLARGKLSVSSRATCSGTVRVGGRTAKLSSGCRYSVRLHRHGRVVASFAGTKQIAPRRSSARKF